MTTYIQVMTTLDDSAAAESLAAEILRRKLAGCIQIIPCRSMYRWQGRVEKESEHLCIMKSTRSLFPKLEEAIRELHPYDVPEILATDVTAGSDEYLRWLDGEVAAGPASEGGGHGE
jgi:periplasmic divalent cation tolerance protein